MGMFILTGKFKSLSKMYANKLTQDAITKVEKKDPKDGKWKALKMPSKRAIEFSEDVFYE
jgi:hypothetical protein